MIIKITSISTEIIAAENREHMVVCASIFDENDVSLHSLKIGFSLETTKEEIEEELKKHLENFKIESVRAEIERKRYENVNAIMDSVDKPIS